MDRSAFQSVVIPRTQKRIMLFQGNHLRKLLKDNKTIRLLLTAGELEKSHES
ncbi:hypothetical protein ACFQI7_01570 [Paenibacillus allorhizosphaerae]|uniref:Uncharacterized protein n=1 Tax=Paenibacillus allorhizosphaerae TaxID=2849866 RepID=A0ABN7TAG6_9BACL|nr:hypothetical protein [Paenibacillus allorhizosphaerae]CAG7616301.1 hypothetical protein PAECIP111802_00272 [Paenibacillus allorhizosphaerae]